MLKISGPHELRGNLLRVRGGSPGPGTEDAEGVGKNKGEYHFPRLGATTLALTGRHDTQHDDTQLIDI
jgi:hypothetical protein